MTPTPEQIERIKVEYKEGDKELTDEEAKKIAWTIEGFTNLIFEVARKEVKLKRRLKKEPDGFPVEDHFSCIICGNSINPETGWHDKWGNKCLLCTKAVKEGIIPTFVCENYDSYYKMWDLNSKFGIKTAIAKKLVRQGELKARIVINNDGAPYHYIFLKSENPKLIDPNRHSPVRKSYDRNRDKASKIWVKESTRELK